GTSTPRTRAPATMSSPPRMTTGNTLSPRSAREKSTPPRTLPRMIPPRVDTTVAMHHESAKTHFTLTPSDSATCWLSAVARMAIPVEEKRKKTENAARSAITTTKLHRGTGDTGTGPRWNGSWENSTGNGRVSLAHDLLRDPRITAATPRATMN